MLINLCDDCDECVGDQVHGTDGWTPPGGILDGDACRVCEVKVVRGKGGQTPRGLLTSEVSPFHHNNVWASHASSCDDQARDYRTRSNA